jgi:hypothetical protein
MLSVVGLPDGDLQRLCDAALAQLPFGAICRIANLMFPQASRDSVTGSQANEVMTNECIYGSQGTRLAH